MSRYERERVATRQRSFMLPEGRALDPVRELLLSVEAECERTKGAPLTPTAAHGAWAQVVSAELALVRGWAGPGGVLTLENALIRLAAFCVRRAANLRGSS